MRRPLLASALALALLPGGCAVQAPLSPAVAVLPAEAEMVPDRLVIVLHGYISSGEQISALVDGLARDPQQPAYHVHNFDFGTFSRVGHSHNAGVEDLADVLTQFYAALPAHCPVCAARADRPVEVTLVARSLGGLIAREALLRDLAAQRAPWRVQRVVTLSAPFSGSGMTRFSTGFLSIVINGFVRTALFGFVNPERGGNFGRVIDAQVRALRLGSPYLWEAHRRWREHLTTEPSPDWLAVTAIGNPKPELRGDGVVRFASGNIAPLLPQTDTETLLLDVAHFELFNKPCGGHCARELDVGLLAIRRFIEDGSLARDPDLAPHTLARTAEGALTLARTPPPDAEALQTIYLQPSGADRDLKLARFGRVLAQDAGDVWLHFFAGDPDSPEGAREIVLSRALSVFQEGPEWAWQELDPVVEPNAEGVLIPTTMSVGPTHSHLIHIPDVAPAGTWQLQVRLAGVGILPAGWLQTRTEGRPTADLPATAEGWEPLPVYPLQANLVRVYLDEASIRAAHPGLGALVLEEVALQPVPR